MAHLESLKYRELQLLAKQHGLRANAKSDELIAMLKAVLGAVAAPAESKSPGGSQPTALAAAAPSPCSSAMQRSPRKSAAPVANPTVTEKAPPSLVKTSSLLQSPGWARRRSSVGKAVARADANKPDDGEEEEEEEESVAVPSAIDSRRVELIRQKVEARKLASKAHRTSRADERKGKADKVSLARPRPTQPAKVVHRCPGTHLGVLPTPGAAKPVAALDCTPRAPTAAAATPKPPGSSWLNTGPAASGLGSAAKPTVAVLERSPFVALKSVKKLTEPVDFKFNLGGVASATGTLRGSAKPKAVLVAERRRLAEEKKAREKARMRDEARRKIASHHSEFAAATGLGGASKSAAVSDAAIKRPLAPAELNAPPRAEPWSAKTTGAAPTASRVGVKHVVAGDTLRQHKVERFAANGKARRNAKMLAARQV